MLSIPSQGTTVTVDSDADNNKKVSESSRLFHLCPEVLINAVQFLEPIDLCVLGSVCHPLRSVLLVADPIVWRTLCRRMWASRQGFRRFCDQMDISVSLYSADASQHIHVKDINNNGPSSSIVALQCRPMGSRLQSHHRANQKMNPVALSPNTTLQCIKASILPEHMKNIPPAPFSLPKPALGSPSPTTRRFWWELSPQEQVRRLRRMLHASASKTDDCSSSSASSSGCDDDTTVCCGSTIGGTDLSTHVTWKFAYFQSIRDCRRRTLTAQDLHEGTWTISFRQIPEQTFPAVFRPDGMLVTPLNPDGLRYQLSQQGQELNVHVFPVITVNRSNNEKEDWGWRLCNYFVSITSTDIPLPLYLQRLHRNSSLRPP